MFNYYAENTQNQWSKDTKCICKSNFEALVLEHDYFHLILHIRGKYWTYLTAQSLYKLRFSAQIT